MKILWSPTLKSAARIAGKTSVLNSLLIGPRCKQWESQISKAHIEAKDIKVNKLVNLGNFNLKEISQVVKKLCLWAMWQQTRA